MAKGDSYAASQLFMGLTPKNGFKAAKLYCYKPIDGSGDFTWARNLTAYRLNQSGSLELMGVNVPRIDYTNTCPELLIEGARENLITYSQDISNADWTKVNSPTITTNVAIAPDGTTTADGIQSTISGDYRVIQQSKACSAGDTFTASIFVKKETSETNYGGAELAFIGGTIKTCYIIFNAVTGGYNIASNTITPIVKVIELDNYWRYEITGTDTGSNTSVTFAYYATLSNNGTTLGNNAGSVRTIWGLQLEKADYASSYIPTTTTAVTRPQDTNSSTIAFTGDGFSYNLRVRLENRGDLSTPDNVFFIEDSSGLSDTYIGCYVLGDNLVFTFYNNPDLEEFSISLADGIHNIGVALDCTTGDYEIVVDGASEFAGTLVSAYNSANVYERVKLGCLAASTDSIGLNRIIGLQVYNSVLSQAELIEYTTA